MAGEFTAPSITSNDAFPEEEKTLYVTLTELNEMLGFTVTTKQIRFAMSLVNGHCNRRTFFPDEYEERLDLPSDRNQAKLAFTPVLRIVNAAGRYAYGRRDRRTMNQVNYDYIAALAVFGSPPRFSAIDVNQIEVFPATGEIWLPTGFFLINYSQVQIRYVAGFTEIPARVKSAVALLINNVAVKGAGDRTSYSVGRVSRRFATASFIDRDVALLLDPFVVRSYA